MPLNNQTKPSITQTAGISRICDFCRNNKVCNYLLLNYQSAGGDYFKGG